MAGLEIHPTRSTKIMRSISAMNHPHNRPGGRAGLTSDFTHTKKSYFNTYNTIIFNNLPFFFLSLALTFETVFSAQIVHYNFFTQSQEVNVQPDIRWTTAWISP